SPLEEWCPVCGAAARALATPRLAASGTDGTASARTEADQPPALPAWPAPAPDPPTVAAPSPDKDFAARETVAFTGSATVAMAPERPAIPGYEIVDELGRGGM